MPIEEQTHERGLGVMSPLSGMLRVVGSFLYSLLRESEARGCEQIDEGRSLLAQQQGNLN